MSRTSTDEVLIRERYIIAIKELIYRTNEEGWTQTAIIKHLMDNYPVQGVERSRSWYRSIVRTLVLSSAQKPTEELVDSIRAEVERKLADGLTESGILDALMSLPQYSAESESVLFAAIHRIVLGNAGLKEKAKHNLIAA